LLNLPSIEPQNESKVFFLKEGFSHDVTSILFKSNTY
jgi:hypothetical protein